MSVMPLKLAVAENYPESTSKFNDSISILDNWINGQLVSLGEQAASSVTSFVDSFPDRINSKKGLINRATDIYKIFDNGTMVLEYEYAIGRMRVRLRKLPEEILEAYKLANIVDAPGTTKELSKFSLNVISLHTSMILLGVDLGTFKYTWDYDIDQGTFWFIESDIDR